MLARLQRQCGNNYKQIFASVFMKTHGDMVTIQKHTCQDGFSIDKYLLVLKQYSHILASVVIV